MAIETFFVTLKGCHFYESKSDSLCSITVSLRQNKCGNWKQKSTTAMSGQFKLPHMYAAGYNDISS